MPDFSAYLPLSNRPRRDESEVSSDRRVQVADLLDEAARIVAASHLGAVEVETFLRTARLPEAPVTADGPAARLSATAVAVRDGARCSIRVLRCTLEALLRLAAAAETIPAVAAGVSGAVALERTGSAPFERRVVVAGHTLRATDAGWEFGRGPVLEAPALTIVSFLLELSDEPPRPPAPTAYAEQS